MPAGRSNPPRNAQVVDTFNLRGFVAAYAAINPRAASGVDQVTWDAYGQNLRANLEDLLGRAVLDARIVRRKFRA